MKTMHLKTKVLESLSEADQNLVDFINTAEELMMETNNLNFAIIVEKKNTGETAKVVKRSKLSIARLALTVKAATRKIEREIGSTFECIVCAETRANVDCHENHPSVCSGTQCVSEIDQGNFERDA